jgi:hypothetical protein
MENDDSPAYAISSKTGKQQPLMNMFYAAPGMRGVGSSAASSAASGSSTSRSSIAPLAPGQSSRFTPDPTVGGAWTHTRADVPLFKPMGATPATPATPGGAGTPATPATPSSGRGWGSGGLAANPAFQNWRTSMDTWRQQRPQMPQDMQSSWMGQMDQWRQKRPERPDFRSMLADILAGK